MSTIIGTDGAQGTLKCFIHEYETLDINEWNDHCENEGHTDSGTTQCIDCNCGITFTDIPYQRITPAGKQIQLRCPECFTKYSAQKLKIDRIEGLPEEGDNQGTVQPPLQQEEAPNTEQQLRENPKPNLRGAKIL